MYYHYYHPILSSSKIMNDISYDKIICEYHDNYKEKEKVTIAFLVTIIFRIVIMLSIVVLIVSISTVLKGIGIIA